MRLGQEVPLFPPSQPRQCDSRDIPRIARFIGVPSVGFPFLSTIGIALFGLDGHLAAREIHRRRFER